MYYKMGIVTANGKFILNIVWFNDKNVYIVWLSISLPFPSSAQTIDEPNSSKLLYTYVWPYIGYAHDTAESKRRRYFAS